MTIPKMDSSCYIYPAEKWDKEKCEKMAKIIAKDGLGTPYPFKGYIGSGLTYGGEFGTTIYNGGCVREDKWYQGEHRPLPEVAEGFEIEYVPTWGYRIKKLQVST